MSGRKPKARPEQCCFTCRHWDGKVKAWQDVGETTGSCNWLANLVVTHSHSGIPNWIEGTRLVRLTYDDDTDCPAWAARTEAPSHD